MNPEKLVNITLSENAIYDCGEWGNLEDQLSQDEKRDTLETAWKQALEEAYPEYAFDVTIERGRLSNYWDILDEEDINSGKLLERVWEIIEEMYPESDF